MESVIDRTSKISGKRASKLFHHLPPTAVPVKVSDLSHAVRALLDPIGASEKCVAALKESVGNRNLFLTSSGRSALSMILLALKRNSSRSRVILPAYTCPSVAQAILWTGLQPIFCDIDTRTLDMDRVMLRGLLDEQVLAIVPTHLYGLAQDISDLVDIGRRSGIYIIEDAAQAFGATVNGRMVGNAGDLGFFSLGRGKCIPAGHGGVIVSDDRFVPDLKGTIQEKIPDGMKRDLSSLLRFIAYALATTPLGWWFIVRSPLNPAEDGMDITTLPAIKYVHLSPTQAGIAKSMLERMDQINATRRKNAHRLMALLCEHKYIHLPETAPGCESVFLRLPIVLDEKPRADRLFHLLSKAGIGVSRSYTRTLPDIFSVYHTASPKEFSGAAHLADCLLTLPTHPYLQTDDLMRIRDIIDTV